MKVLLVLMVCINWLMGMILAFIAGAIYADVVRNIQDFNQQMDALGNMMRGSSEAVKRATGR